MTSTERSRKRREMQRKGATEPGNATKTDATATERGSDATEIDATVPCDATGDATVCTHPPIIAVTKANRHLSYSKIGTSLPDRQPEVIEPKMVTCPCCGKEWECRRPDIQSPYCLRCERGVEGSSWREQDPYVRPPYEDRAKAMQALAK